MRITSFNDLVSTAMAMSGIPPLSEEEAKAEVVGMLETPGLTRPKELAYEDEVGLLRDSWELGEIGYSLMRFPERREDAWRMLEDGASMAEIMEKHEDLATEIVGNIIIDPVWFIPPAWAEKALPVGRVLSKAAEGIKKLPYIGRLIQTTKAGWAKTYGYVISDVMELAKMVPGGGAIETELSKEVRNFARKVGGREQLAIEAFSEALEVVPRTLADNAGLDILDTMVELKAAHEKVGGMAMGVNVFKEGVIDMLEQGVVEPMVVKQQAVKSAVEVSSMILRIDDVVAASGAEAGPGAGGPGGPGEMPDMDEE